MISVNSIFQQKLSEIQSRTPVKLNMPAKTNQVGKLDGYSDDSLQNGTQTSFQALLKRELDLINPGYDNLSGEASDNTTSGASDKSYIDTVINKASAANGLDPNLIKAIVKAESSFNPNTVSSAGAMGLMQLMPFNAEAMGVSDPFDIEQNINAGTKMIKGHLDQYNGDLTLALAAYNAGSGAVKKYGGVPPYKETQNYIKNVTKYAQEYRQNGDN